MEVLRAITEAGNVGSLNVLRKCGFRETGRFLYENGALRVGLIMERPRAAKTQRVVCSIWRRLDSGIPARRIHATAWESHRLYFPTPSRSLKYHIPNQSIALNALTTANNAKSRWGKLPAVVQSLLSKLPLESSLSVANA
jgi:hypothetical protein